MNRISPISYIRKQKKMLAAVSLWVAGIQIFGQSFFIENNQTSEVVFTQNHHVEPENPLNQTNVFNKPLEEEEESTSIVDENSFSPIPSSSVDNVSIVNIPVGEPVVYNEDLTFEPEINKQGIIGKSETFPIDDPSDNVFPLKLDRIPGENQNVYLSYELYGLADASGTAITINDNFSRGGYLVKKSNTWMNHKEQINPEELIQGFNFIRFSTLESADYQYMVKNVQLIIEDKTDQSNQREFTIHQTQLNSYDGKLYISGFADKNSEVIKINEIEVPVINGNFESIVENVKDEIKITQGEKEISLLVNNQSEGADKFLELSSADSFVQSKFIPANEGSLTHEGASLNVSANSIKAETTFYMSALRYQDLSVVSPEMVNVTGNHSGYRLLPHGEHFVNAPATIEIPYDESKIPAGYKPLDIKTFYFDSHQSKWIALQRDTVLLDRKIIVSKTTHFTDFVNGIIKVPESPETGSFTPTSIKDIKAADPAAGIISIPPPTPNNMGTASTSFPIKLPAGRAGMQPSLSVNYNSEGGNGWMGIGWDVSVPSISIDTRWGAPRYDIEKETEIYSLGGGMLTLQNGSDYTNPHRTADIVRVSERQFYPRIEGSYAKIIRHGNKPHNYWWEVTDKMGNKSFYGGNGTAVVPNAVIRTGPSSSDPIAHWALYRTEDANGNYVEYSYTQGNSTAGHEFYPKDIVYTKHKSENKFQNNHYKVSFTLSSPITTPSPDRTDIQTNARLGLVQATSKLLNEIKVDLVEGGVVTPIRSYRFEYQNPNFSKKQLTKISEYDADGDLFYSNTMDYDWEEGVTDGSFMEANLDDTWNGSDDGIDGELVLSGMSADHFTNEGSPLGFSTGWGANGGVSVGVGTGFNIASKALTAGASFDYSYSQNNGIISFIDINGDNLPDKVIRRGNNLTYRKNLGNTEGGMGGFGAEYDISGIDRFSESTSNSTSFGFEANFLLFVGYMRNNSKSITKTYFSDVNGDGLVDLVNNGTVRFNIGTLTSDNSDLNYNILNSLTPNAINGGEGLNQSAIDELNIEIENEFQQNNPLHDVVKVWIAPAPGNYSINPSTITLSPTSLPAEDDEYLTDYDGVKVSIELGNVNSQGSTTLKWSENIKLINDDGSFNQDLMITSPILNLNGLKKGQKVYFRVNSVQEGSYDRVEWSPSINFTGSRIDANNLSYYTSTAQDGFIVSGESFVTIPQGTTAKIDWDFNNAQYTIPAGKYSDNLIYRVIIGQLNEQNGSFNVSKIYTQYVNQNITSTTIIKSESFSTGLLSDPSLKNYTLQAGQSVKFEVLSDSNVDWSEVKWEPQVQITHPSNQTTITSGLVNYSIYKNIIHNSPGSAGNPGPPMYNTDVSGIPPTSYIRNIDPLKAVTINIDHSGNHDWAASEFDGVNVDDAHPLAPERCYPVQLVVKNANKKIIKKQPFYVKASDEGQLYDKIYKTNQCSDLNSTYYYGDSFNVIIPVSSDPNLLLTAPLYVELHTDSINLAYQEMIYANVYQNNNFNQPELKSPTVTNIYARFPSGKFGMEYRNWGQFSYNSTIAPGDINETNLKLYQPGENMPEGNPFEDCVPPGEGEDATDYEACMQAQFDLLGIEGPGETKFIIMNPNPKMQLADETVVPNVWEGYDEGIYVEKNAFSGSRLGINNINTVLVQVPDGGANVIQGIPLVSKGEGNSYAGNAGPVGGSTSDGKNRLLNQYMDMNGDRYPDLLNRNTVQYTSPRGDLNETKDLGFGEVIESTSNSKGATVSGTFKIANTPAIDQKYQKTQMAKRGEKMSADSPVQLPSGGSASLSIGDNDSSEESLWIDMNGDGLPDRVEFNDNMTVRLNLGYKLDIPKQWLNSPDEMSSESKTYSGGIGFSMFFNSISGGVSGSSSNGFTKENFADINGDGLPDYLKEDNGATVKYRLNTGNGFSPTWHTISNSHINTNRSIGEGANIAFTVGFTLFLVKFTVTPRIGINRSLSRTEHTISDINGDGYPDILYTASGSNANDGDLHVRLNKTGKTHLLKQVNTPLGGSWKIDYEREQNTYEMPNAKWKLSSIIVNDGFTGDNTFSLDETKASVEYTNPKHDRREREFMGYEKVRVNQLDQNGNPYRYSLQEFHNNSYYLKGAVKKEELYDANNTLWTSTETTYAIMNRGTITPSTADIDLSNHIFNSNDFDMAIDKSSLFVSPIKTTKKIFEPSGSKTTFTEIQSFDADGNIKKYMDNGEGGSDVVTTEINYLSNNATFRGLPTSIDVKIGGTPIRHREANYNPTTGNLNNVITKLNNSDNAKVSFKHDIYGNILKVTHEESVDKNGQKFFYAYTYDDKLHTYPIKVTDAFGYSSNSTYDYRFGALVYSEDMNYQPMRTRIDDRGRVVEITGPYELFVEGLTNNDPAWTIRFEYKGEGLVAKVIQEQGIQFTDYVVDAVGSFVPSTSGNSSHHAVTRHFDPEFRSNPDAPATTNEIFTITIIDGLGKPIQVKKSIAVKKPTPPTYHPGDITPAVVDARDDRKWLISGKVKTDAFGRALETYYPTVEALTLTSGNPQNASFNYTAALDTAPPTKATYDVLDRVLTTTLPGESTPMTTSYSIDSNLFKTMVVNEKGQTKYSLTDIRGRTTKVVEQSNAEGDITTLFKYNAIGELLEVEDAGGNKTLSTYDLAGRRTELRHPDNGITKFKYDKASNLIEKETSNLLAINEGDKIKYNYTFNRLDSISYPLNPHNNVQFFYGQAEDASAADDFTVGRLWYQIDASGVQQFKYGRLGEVIYNLRSVAVPGDKAYWFQTQWEYDTWNRVKKIIYPDEEEVSYFYNRGGELHAMTSKKNGQQNKNIVSQMGYDHFGQRTYLRYGNGTETTYKYEANRRRLDIMEVKSNTAGITGQNSSVNRTFINNKYTYDILSNITNVVNSATDPTTTQIGGKVTYGYTYDDLNRLTIATGVFTGRNSTGAALERQQYTLNMSYDKLHNIVSKQQLHQSAPGATGGVWTDIPATTYRLDYKDESEDGYASAEYNVAGYQYTQPHAPRKIIDKPKQTSTGNDIKTKLHDYDENGNLTHVTQKTGASLTVEKLRTNLWDEENRLRAVDITPDAEGVRPIAIYTYDAGGERILKHSNTSVSIFLNGKKVADTIQTDATIYPSGMLVAKLGNNGSEEEQTLAYTKHYYAGTQRVSSKIGTTENLGDFLQDWYTGGIGGPVDVVGSSNGVLANAEEGVVKVYEELEMTPPTFDSSPVFIPVASFIHGIQEIENYWFHPDHLGSSSYITNFVGEVSQHMEYFAFGETFVEEHRSSNNSPYKFNGKELDEETGWYYYGARYYDPRTSVWLSVDPLAEKYPTLSPYIYTANNPIKFIDPDGRQIDPASKKKVDEMKTEINTSITSLSTQRDAITASATNKKGMVKYSKEQQAQVSDLNYRIAELNTAHSDLVAMENDKNMTFKLNAVTGTIANLVVSATDVQTNTYTLNYISGDMGNQIHEVAKHGSQILNGDLLFSVDSSGNVLTSVRTGTTSHDLEVSAYKAQYSYTGALEGHRTPTKGSQQETLNNLMGATGTGDQINEPFRVTNYNDVNNTLIKSMTEQAIGSTLIYP